MLNNDSKKISIVLLAVFLIIVITISFLLARNINFKKKLSDLQSALYIWKAEELAKVSKRTHKDAVVILNEEEGLWDKSGEPSIEVVHDLTLGEDDENEHYLFYRGGDVIADDDGNIYVLLRVEGLIRKFDRNGKYLLTIGREGQGPGEFIQPTRFLIDNRNTLHVIEYGNQRVSKFSLDGQYIDSTPLQFQGIPRQFGLDENNNYYVSFYDRESETSIHKYNSQGQLIKSFGETLYLTRPVHYAERGTFIGQCTQGHIFTDKNSLYFSRRNPYDIRKYSYDGELKMLIFRKNSFMPPDKMIIVKQGYSFYPSVQPKFIAVRNNKIINLILVPEKGYESSDIGWVIDIFDLKGNLLTSYKSQIKFVPTFIDKNNRIYGFSGDLTKIYRFSLKFKHSKNNERR